jgi:hypothetical protein
MGSTVKMLGFGFVAVRMGGGRHVSKLYMVLSSMIHSFCTWVICANKTSRTDSGPFRLGNERREDHLDGRRCAVGEENVVGVGGLNAAVALGDKVGHVPS